MTSKRNTRWRWWRGWVMSFLLVVGLNVFWVGMNVTTANANTASWMNLSGSPSNVNTLLDMNGTTYAGTDNGSNDVWAYNGSTWTQMSGSPGGVKILLNMNGTLYAGTYSGNNDVWSYNGSTWTQMSGSPGYVKTLLEVNGTLYAGTWDGSLYGSNDVWTYNGSTWTQMTGSPSYVETLVDVKGTLYAGTYSGTNDVWSYNGSAWTQMGGSPSMVSTLLDVNSTLYAGTSGSNNGVWSYTGSAWTQMNGSPGRMRALLDMNGTLYAGGDNGVGVYDGSTWTQMSGSPSNVRALLNVNGAAYAGTYNGSADVWTLPLPLSAPNNVQASATTSTSTTLSWDAVTGATSYNVYENGTKVTSNVSGTSYTVSGLTPGASYVFTVTAVNASGESAQSNQVTVNTPTANTNSASWMLMSGSPITVQALLEVNGTLYAGAYNGSHDVWSYNGSTWTQMNGSPSDVNTLFDVNGTLYAGVLGSNAVWSYSGSTWTQMSGSPSNVNTLAYVNGTLYAGAYNGSNDVWSYNGSTWTQMSGSPSYVNTLVNVNGTLYAGAYNNGNSGVLTYNGSTWTQVSGSPSNVKSLVDVNGTLYAGIYSSGSNEVWIYNGSKWTQIGGSPSIVNTLLDVNGTLYAGTFTNGSGNGVWSYNGGTWTQMSGSPGNVSSLIDMNGTPYAGTSSGVWSLSQPLSAPTNVRAGWTTSTATTLTWGAVNGATSYNVYENGKQIGSNVSVSIYRVSGLTQGSSYSFSVTAVNASGESAQSTPVTVITPHANTTLWINMIGSPVLVNTLLHMSDGTPNGTFYAGSNTLRDSVWSYNSNTWQLMSGSQVMVMVSALAVDTHGTLYAGTEVSSHGVWSYNGSTWTQMSGSPSDVFTLLYVNDGTPNGTLYAATGTGNNDVWSYNGSTWTQMSGSPGNVNTLLDVNGTLYAGANQGIWSYSYNANTWTKVSGSPSGVKSLLYLNGTLYAGTNSGGLDASDDVWFYNGRTWTQMSGSPGNVNSLLDVNGTLYAGTFNDNDYSNVGNDVTGGDIWFYDGNAWTQMTNSPSDVHTMLDVNGTLYAGTWDKNTNFSNVWVLPQPLGAPTNVHASATTSTSTTLTWDAVTGATNYNVYENGTKIASDVSGTLYPVTGLTPGNSYSFTVSAVNTFGESPQSSAASVVTVPSLDIKTQAIGPGSVAGSTEVTVSPNTTGDTFAYALGSTPAKSPKLGDPLPVSAIAYTSGADILKVQSGDYLDIYEVNGSNKIQAWHEYHLTSGDIDSSAGPITLVLGSSTVMSGQTITVTGVVYQPGTQLPLANTPVTLSASGGSWISGGQSVNSAVFSVYTGSQGKFELSWESPTTPSVYTLSASSNGSTVKQYVNVTKYITGSVTTQPITSSTTADVVQTYNNIPSPKQTSSTVTVNIVAGTFSQDIPVWVTSTSDVSQITPSGTQVVAAVGVDFSGTPQKPITLTIQNTNIAPGDVVYKILPDGTYQRISSVSISKGQANITFSSDPNFVVVHPLKSPHYVPLAIGTAWLWNGQYGVPYNALQLQAVSGQAPYAWSLVSGSLPSGLSLSSTGVISGTPTGPDGTSTFTVQVQATNGIARRTLSILIFGAPPLSLTTTSLPSGADGKGYLMQLQATGVSPLRWSVTSGALPAGMSLNTDGTLTGTPSESGHFSFTVQVTDASGSKVQHSLALSIAKLGANLRIITFNGQILVVPVVVRGNTTYMPIWYVMKLLKSIDIQSTWDGKAWRMTSSTQPNLSSLGVGHGNASIYLNGIGVQNVNTVASTDPSTSKPTTYMPIWYVMQSLQRLGLHSTWNGTTWIVTK